MNLENRSKLVRHKKKIMYMYKPISIWQFKHFIKPRPLSAPGRKAWEDIGVSVYNEYDMKLPYNYLLLHMHKKYTLKGTGTLIVSIFYQKELDDP